jgi:hypothetical protein
MWNTLKRWMWRDFERTLETGVALSAAGAPLGLVAVAAIGSGIALAEQVRGKNLLPALTELHGR